MLTINSFIIKKKLIMKCIKFCSYGVLTIISLFFIGNHYYNGYKLKKETQQDIEFIHKTILENHPGPYNNQDPEFIHNMDVAYSIAKMLSTL